MENYQSAESRHRIKSQAEVDKVISDKLKRTGQTSQDS